MPDTDPIFSEPCPFCGVRLDVAPLRVFAMVDWRQREAEDGVGRYNTAGPPALASRLPSLEIECSACGAEVVAVLSVRLIRRPEDMFVPGTNVLVTDALVGQRNLAVAGAPEQEEARATPPEERGAAPAAAFLQRILAIRHVKAEDYATACLIAGDALHEPGGEGLRNFARMYGFRVPPRATAPSPPSPSGEEPTPIFCASCATRRVPAVGLRCIICARKEPGGRWST